jgi:tetratricopeptide (TPR) repeat protein
MLIVEASGNQIRRRLGGQGAGAILPAPTKSGGPLISPQNEPMAALADWAERYARAVSSGSEDMLRQIGEEIFAWLDQGGALDSWRTEPEPALEVRVNLVDPGPLAEALLAMPWEILCLNGTFLAVEKIFAVARRCGGNALPITPRHSDLSLMFMAAAPEGQSELDHEAEEVAILDATKAKDDRPALAHVQVEESGALEFLCERLRLDGPFEALHISCHGDILARDGGESSPMLLLETPTGEADATSPRRLVEEMGGNLPSLVFVSACRTAERGSGRKASGAPEGYRHHGLAEAPGIWDAAPSQRDAGGPVQVSPDLAEPFVRRLSVHAANVLGWDGSVYDRDASRFAKALYGALARGDTVPKAAARARRSLWKDREKDPRQGRHWHLARLYLGPGGGGALCDPTSGAARDAATAAEEAFLDPLTKRVPVATRSEFVGRRRQIQTALKAYRDGTKGVLIHGMGNLGKSSLAARIAARMPRHRAAVVYGRCDALAIFGALKPVVEDIAATMPLAESRILLAEMAALESAIAEDEATLGDALLRLLKGPLKAHPVLLILDDLEQSLEKPTKEKAVVAPAAPYRGALAATLSVFSRTNAMSRLLLTSRYDFAIPDGAGGDPASVLARVHLRPMLARERRKQVSAKARVEGKEAMAAMASALIDAALAVAGGNPGLQDALTRPILNGEEAAANRAIETVEAFHATGALPPADQDPGDFFQRMAFETYADALTGAERTALSAATLFTSGIAIPRAALEAAAEAMGLADPSRAMDRLLSLGLLDDWGMMAGWHGAPTSPHAAVNPLARPLASRLEPAATPVLAAAAAPRLGEAWRDHEGDFPRDARGVEASRIAIAAKDVDPALLEAAATGAVIFLYGRSHDANAALDLARPVLAALATAGHPPGPALLGQCVNAAERTGDAELQEQLLDQALARNDLDDSNRAQFLALRAGRLIQSGNPDGAMGLLKEAEAVFTRLGDVRSRAVTMGQIADILGARGDTDEALRIRREEELPVYERLGDVRSRAVTMGQIADILGARGDTDEALRIRREEQLPVFERLGDVRSRAVTMGKIADILGARGDTDEALRIRREEQLPVFERLGDVRERAVTMGQIADILGARGDTDEALRIRREEQLPVYERLGDVRSRAVTMGKIADILGARGDTDEALRVLREELLPVFERLGDVRSRAVTMGKIAQALQAQGDLDGALAMHLERLPVAQELQDINGIAHIRFSCAQLRLQRGDHKSGGLQVIHDELAEAFEINLKLQHPDGVGAVGLLLGQLLAMGGQREQAVEVLRAAVAAFEKIGQAEGAAQCREIIGIIGGDA